MDGFTESRESRDYACRCAMLGCALCQGPIRMPPAGDPFSWGKWAGRYFCDDCWNIHYSEHPNELADNASREYVKKRAEKIKAERASNPEVLFKEGESVVILTQRGTLAFRLERSEGMEIEEFDPARFGLLVRAFQAVSAADVPGYSTRKPDSA